MEHQAHFQNSTGPCHQELLCLLRRLNPQECGATLSLMIEKFLSKKYLLFIDKPVESLTLYNRTSNSAWLENHTHFPFPCVAEGN